MLDGERISGVACLTKGWLVDSSSLNVALLLAATLKADKVSFFHLWNNIRAADHNTFELDKLVNRDRVNLSDPIGLS